MAEKSAIPPSAAAVERTRVQALRELRSLLSEVMSTAAGGEHAPAAFKNAQNREHLITRTEARLADAWKQRFEPRRDGQAPKQAQTLELLSEDEHEQALASERFVNEVLQENAEPLEDLDAQLAAMSGVQVDPTRGNPLGPNAWAEGLRSGVRDIECSSDDRDWLMEQVMPLLADRVPDFFSAMSKQMASAGFAPARRAGQRGRAEPRAAATALSAAPEGAAAGGFAPELVEARSGPAQPLLGAGGFDDDGTQLDHLLGMIGAQRGGAGGEGGEAGAGAGAGGDGGGGAAPARAWSQDDLMSVLNVLQTNAAAGGGATSVADMRKAIGSAAEKIGLEGGARAMPAQAQDTLALVSMLFEVLLDGKRLDERARSQLARLVVPYVRVAVVDRALFMQSVHPGRRVLNLLVEALETASPDLSKHAHLRDMAFEAIEQIVTGFADDLSFFDPIEKTLAAEIGSSRKRAELSEKRAAEAQGARERREQARDSVAAFLSEALFGKRMPNVLLEFLVGPWQHHQNVTVLREGEHADEAIANQQLLRDLLAASERGYIDAADRMQSRLAEVLASSGHADAAPELMQQLLAAIRPAPPPAPKPALAAKPGETVSLPAAPPAALVKQVVVEREVLAASAAAIVPAQKTEDAFLAPEAIDESLPVDLVQKYEAMPLGTWIDLVAEDGRITSAKISWVSPISGKRILSNRRGQRTLCASVQELATMETEGQIRPRHSEAAFEQALHTVSTRLEASA